MACTHKPGVWCETPDRPGTHTMALQRHATGVEMVETPVVPKFSSPWFSVCVRLPIVAVLVHHFSPSPFLSSFISLPFSSYLSFSGLFGRSFLIVSPSAPLFPLGRSCVAKNDCIMFIPHSKRYELPRISLSLGLYDCSCQ